MFDIATRQKIRFDFKGKSSVEDMWDCTITEINDVYKPIKKELNSIGEDSLLDTIPHKEKATLQLKVSILEHIVNVKKAEAKAKADSLAKKQEIQQLRDLMQRKQNEQIESLPMEKIAERLAALESSV